MLLLHPAHGHAHVLGVHHHADSLGVRHLHQGLGDLARQALLDLQARREHVDNPGDLGQTDHLAIGQVGHMHLADDRQQVMLAQGVQFDIAQQHHLVVVRREQGPVDDTVQVLVIATGEILHCLRGAHRGIQQALALRVLAQTGEDVAVALGELFRGRQWLARGIGGRRLVGRPGVCIHHRVLVFAHSCVFLFPGPVRRPG